MSQLNRRAFLLSGLALGIELPIPLAAAPDPPSPLPAALRGDARLERPVNLRRKRDPLSDVLADLRDQTGARVEASPEVAYEPAIVFVSGQPARDVMAQIAALFHYRWRRRGEAPAYRYELYQDETARHEEENLRAQEWQRLRETFRAQIGRYERLSRRPVEELLKEAKPLQAAVQVDHEGLRNVPQEEQAARQLTREWRERHAQLAALLAMADPQRRALLRILTALTPAQWDALLEQEPLVFSTLSEPGALPLPQAVEDALRSHPIAYRMPGENPFTIPEIEERDRKRIDQLREEWRRAEGFRVVIEARLTTYMGPRSFSLAVRPGAVLPERRQSSVWGQELRISTATLNLDDPPTPETSPEDAARDPLLSARRRLELEMKPETSNAWWNAWLTVVPAGLAKSYRVNLIADGYRCMPPPPPERSRDDLSLYEALNYYLLPACRWTQDGAFVRVRRRRWYAERLTEIPAPVEEQWAEYLKGHRALTLDETAAWIQSFSDDQLEECFGLAMEERRIRLPEAMDPVVNSSAVWPRKLFRAYAALPEELKKQLKAGQPVAYAAMPLAAREPLRKALREDMRDRSYSWYRPPALEELASGGLALGILELRRAVRPEVYGNRPGFTVDYLVTGVSGEATIGDRQITEGDSLLRLGASETPAPEGQAVHAVQLRYRLPDGRGVDFTAVLPWVHLLSKPDPAASQGAKPG